MATKTKAGKKATEKVVEATPAEGELTSRPLADQLRSQLIVDKGGLIEKDDDAFFESTLEGTGLTLDVVRSVQEHVAKVTPAATLAGGEAAHEHFKDNPDTTEVSMSYRVGHDVHHAFFNRPSGDTPASVTVGVDVRGVGDNGELQRVRENLIGLYDDL